MMEPDVSPTLCPICRQPNGCAMAGDGSSGSDCWCRQVAFPAAVLAAVPDEAKGRACICRRCAEGATAPVETRWMPR